MVPIGLALAWAGYTVGIWGYCLVRGYDVTFVQCFKTTWPGGTSSPLLQDSGQGSSGAKPGQKTVMIPAGGLEQ
jgi:hypothetical protein